VRCALEKPMSMKVAIAGIAGRMGRTLAEMVHAAGDLELVGGLERTGSPWLGQSIEAGLSLPSATGAIIDDIAALPEFDVLLDFTTTQSTLAHLATCLTRGTAMVIGTTGFTADEMMKIEQASTHITIVHAQNYSVGLTLLLDLVQQTSSKVGAEADVEILEWHHNQKVDAPSGTAYALLQAVKAGRQNARGSIVHGREGLVGARPSGEIGLHAIRGGDIIGEHQVLFAMNGERIELTHRAASRSNFAEGALRAARWGIAGGAAGLFDMRDVLGLDPAPSD
jgi:4-hydroxy-tetrahydrodipicolinate reductase